MTSLNWQPASDTGSLASAAGAPESRETLEPAEPPVAPDDKPGIIMPGGPRI
jgi:hypothetical protein